MKKIITLLLLSFVYINSNAQGLTLPYNNGFDSITDRADWLEYHKGVRPDNTWNFNGALSHDYNVGGNDKDTVRDWVVSPALNFSGPGKISFKVRTGGFSTPTPDNCDVWFGTDSDPDKGNYQLIGNISYMLPQGTWLDTSFDIPFTSSKGFIAFKYKTIGSAWATYAIDDISITLNNSASVKGISKENTFTVFPNPAQNSATVFISGELVSDNLSVGIYDILGKEISRYTNISNNQINLPGNLPKGIYFIKLMNKAEIIGSKKLLIQ